MLQFEIPPEYRDRGAIAAGAWHLLASKTDSLNVSKRLINRENIRPRPRRNASVVILRNVYH